MREDMKAVVKRKTLEFLLKFIASAFNEIFTKVQMEFFFLILLV